MLSVIDRIPEISFVKLTFAPLSAEIAELRFGMVESIPVPPGYVPDRIAVVQILVYMINERRYGIRLIWAALGPELGLGKDSSGNK